MSPANNFTSFEGEPKLLSPMVLAFIGDGVFELLVRSNVLKEKGNIPANKLHKYTVNKVNAKAQADFYDTIIDILDDDESTMLKRGRNATLSRVPKNSSVEDYHKATAVETLFGYLYLCGKMDRILHLFSLHIKEDSHEESAN